MVVGRCWPSVFLDQEAGPGRSPVRPGLDHSSVPLTAVVDASNAGGLRYPSGLHSRFVARKSLGTRTFDGDQYTARRGGTTSASPPSCARHRHPPESVAVSSGPITPLFWASYSAIE